MRSGTAKVTCWLAPPPATAMDSVSEVPPVKGPGAVKVTVPADWAVTVTVAVLRGW